MNRQVLLDKLSEFLMVEQGGFQLYKVLSERTQMEDLRAKYIEFGDETSRHREILATVIKKLGGDPGYVSPLARVAQIRAESMLNIHLVADGLSPQEEEAVGLECVLLAETKDHADWEWLGQLVASLPAGAEKDAIVAAVEEVESQEDEHLSWAREQCALLATKMLVQEPEPPLERWQMRWTGPHYNLETHPAPIEKGDGLLKPSQDPAWGPSPIERALGMDKPLVKAGSKK
jgi:rubrerythrin